MRFAVHLHNSRRHHILKSRPLGGLIGLFWLLAVLLAIAVIFETTDLNYQQFLTGFGSSFLRTATAYLIAVIIATVISLVVTANQTVEALFLPVLDVLQSFPSFALFPVLIHALGSHSEVIIITVLVITMIWPILFSIVTAIKNRREELEEAATIFGAIGWKRLWYFSLPELWPAIVTGSIVGWGEGWEFIIGAELLVHVNSGVGKYLGLLGEGGQNTLLAFGVVALMLLLFIINKLLWLPLLRQSVLYQSDT